MAVMARDSWTDSRLDDLNQRVSDLDQRLEAGFADMRAEFREVRAEIDATNRALVQLNYTMLGAMLVGFLGVIATIITQS